jgi:hypothetical protein
MKVPFWVSFNLKMMIPFILLGATLSFGFIINRLSKRRFRHCLPRALWGTSAGLEERNAWIARTCVLIFIMSYTYVIVNLATPFGCFKNEAGDFVMFTQPYLNCFDREWNQNIWSAIFFVVIYTLFLPGLLLSIFWTHRTNLENPWFKKRFYVITDYCKEKYFYWELVCLLRKILFSVTATIIGPQVSRTTRYFLVVCGLFGFLIVEIITFPYSSDQSNQYNML